MPPLQARTQSSQTFLPLHVGDAISGGRLRTASAMNLSIAQERPSQARKLPLKSMSYVVSQRGPTENSSRSVLPDYNNNKADLQSFPLHNRLKKSMFKASDKGSGNILPLASPMGGYATDFTSNGSRRRSAPIDSIKDMTQRLRSRRRTGSTDECMGQLDSSTHMADHNGQHRSRWLATDHSKNRKQTSVFRFSELKHVKKIEWFQILVICTVSFLVYDSYTKALSTTERLERFQNDESMLMLHLRRLEQQSINLHENLSRLGEMSERTAALENQHGGAFPLKTEAVDSNLIRVQTQQLYQMEEELDQELRTLQVKLQHVARSAIIRTYGEGPVKVILDLDFPEGTVDAGNNAISILLWYDTPHAAWTWLQQIRKGEWNGSSFRVGKTFSVDASPAIDNAGTLDFVEKSQKSHDAWTVGLTDNEGNLGMFINLQDNSASRKHDACVGKVIDGFDTLQRLVDVTRRDTRRSVTIQRVTATHLARNQRST